ncbi:MAG: hypothetical protein ACRDGA_08600, partial [Bacteroidota bacterium]
QPAGPSVLFRLPTRAFQILIPFVTGLSRGAFRYEYATVAYSSTGQPFWTNLYTGDQSFVLEASAIAVNEGRVYVAGNSSQQWTSDSYFSTIAYFAAAAPLWTNDYQSGAFNLTITQLTYHHPPS